jgi:peptide/nickel transport system substrate-binding protein
MTQPGRFAQLSEELKSGKIDRRLFLERATALGVGFASALFVANATVVAAAGGSQNGFAVYAGQDGTPAASPAAGGGTPPTTGTEGQTRGQDGELRLLQWQAPTIASPHNATGTKDFLAAQLVLEPLMHYLPDGSIIANLITEVPSVENGLLSKDLSTVTFKLKPDVTWSDGEPFTSTDVQFTFKWVTNIDRTSNLTVTEGVWAVIGDIATPDPLTAVVTYKKPSAAWFDPFTGANNGPIYPSHKFNNDPLNPNEAFLTAPIGTGPFVIDSFSPNDQVTYKINEKYREPNKPAFSTVLLKGGGDAASAARAVLETGEYDYAWNLQVEPAVLQPMLAAGKGDLVVPQGTNVERIHINFSDPNKEVDGQRSEKNTPNPVLSDKAVRDAFNVAVPRALIASQFYGEGEPPTSNLLAGLASFESPNTSWKFDLDAANKFLDDGGWAKDGDYRAKDGVPLSVVYATTINQVRQKTQAVVKQALEAIGCKVQLQQVDAGIYFDSGAGNDQNINHFYWDLAMYTSSAVSPIPLSSMTAYYAGKDGVNIAQKSNGWAAQNASRWVNEEYDKAFEELGAATSFENANVLLIKLNDLVIDNVAVIPEVNRAADKYAISVTLNHENVALGAFEFNYWNIANWNRLK